MATETLDKENPSTGEPVAPNGAASAPQAAAPEPATPAEEAPKKKPPVKALAFGGILLVIAAIFGYRMWSFGQTHSTTDDAYITTDSVTVIPQVSGTIAEVKVDDNQLVKKGDLIAVIDDRQFKAAVDQAQADLDAAIAAAKTAGVSIDLTKEQGSAQIMQAQGAVGQAASGIFSAQADAAKAQAGIAAANAGIQGADAGVAAAQAGTVNAKAGLQKAQAGLKAANAVVASASAQVRAAQADVSSAQANASLAQKTAQRYENLFQQGAISQQAADEKSTAALSAQAQLQAAEQKEAAARAALATQQANLVTAEQGVTSAEAAIQNANAQVNVAKSDRAAASASYTQSLALRRAAQEQVSSANAKRHQAEGQLAQAQTSGTQVSVSQAQHLQALAKVEEAEAALAQAKLNLSYTRIYASMDGRVTNKNLDPGQLVSPNAPILTLVANTGAYVEANYKETQMDGIEPGCKVDISVDAMPDITFKATVQSIQAGTGSSFALLPPENASGNFTKVVQRIPVKITFDPGQPNLDKLIDGESVTAVTTIRGN